MTLLTSATSAQPRESRVRRHRFTVEQFHGMAAAGFLGEDHSRLELLDGEILDLMPIGQRHAAQTNRLTRVLSARLPDQLFLQVQNPVRLNRVSEPMPYISIVEGSETDFLSAPPGPNKIALLIEVADSSLEYDLGQKATAYAEAGIQEYWVVELANRQLRILRQPEGKEYRQSILLKTTDSVSVVGMDFTVEQLLLPEGS